MPENSTNRGYPLPVAGDDFGPQGSVNALGAAVDADVQALADDVADASGINDGAIGPAKLDRAYVVPASLATVATSGDYADLDNLPTLGTAAATDASAYASSAQGALADSAVQPGDLAAVATTGAYSDLSGTPTLGTAAATDASAYATAAQGVKADNAAPLVNVGNLFPANVATGTDTLGNTTGFRSAGGGVIIASSLTIAWQGTRSLRAQAVGTGVQIVSVSTAGTIAQSSGLLPVTPGETIHAEFRLYTSDTTSLWRVRAFAYSEAGTLLTTVDGPLVTGAASWQICTADAVVPASSSLVLVTAYRASGADGGVAYLDGFGCWRGAGGSWRPTGQDIADAGTRVKPTDAAVVQLWNPSTSAWVDAAASSSVVYGTTAGTAAEGDDARIVGAAQAADLATVATSGAYADLTGTPTLGTAAAANTGDFATAAQGALADSAVQVVGSPSVGDVIEWDGSQWVPAAASTGLLPRSATITGATPALAASSFVPGYVAQFSGAVWSAVTEGAYIEFDVLLDAGTYDLTMVGSKNNIQAIATFTLDGAALTTIDTYAASFTANNFMTVTGLTISAGRHVLRVATPTRNASSTGWVLNVNAIQLVRTGA